MFRNYRGLPLRRGWDLFSAILGGPGSAAVAAPAYFDPGYFDRGYFDGGYFS